MNRDRHTAAVIDGDAAGIKLHLGGQIIFNLQLKSIRAAAIVSQSKGDGELDVVTGLTGRRIGGFAQILQRRLEDGDLYVIRRLAVLVTANFDGELVVANSTSLVGGDVEQQGIEGDDHILAVGIVVLVVQAAQIEAHPGATDADIGRRQGESRRDVRVVANNLRCGADAGVVRHNAPVIADKGQSGAAGLVGQAGIELVDDGKIR